MPTPTQVLTERVNNLESVLGSVNEKLDKLFVVKGPERVLAEAAPTTVDGDLLQKAVNEIGESDPIKLEYREIINNVLNQHFAVHSRGTEGGFLFTIVVPERYSSFSPDQKAMLKVDLRGKVIEYALGSLGVKEWAETVFKNFTPEIQSLIVADRLK